MENYTKETLSDSDSSNSSWVLLNEKYCDTESDSDGISVISEFDDSDNNELLPVKVQEMSNISNEQRDEMEELTQDNIEAIVESNTELLPLHISNDASTIKNMFNTTTLISASIVVIVLLITPLMTSTTSKTTKQSVEPYQDTISIAKPIEPLISSVQDFKIKKAKTLPYTGNKHLHIKKYRNSNLSNNQKQVKNSRHFVKPDKSYKAPNKNMFKEKQDEEFEREYKLIRKYIKQITKKLKAKNFSKKMRYLFIKELFDLLLDRELPQKLNNYNNKKMSKKHTLDKANESSAYNINNFQRKRGKNDTKDGQWYSRLHNARGEIRKNERKSEWWFDRAAMRLKLRDKAQWYFQWMVGREETRFKKDY